jgi:hypothetical protein
MDVFWPEHPATKSTKKEKHNIRISSSSAAAVAVV